MYKQDLKQLVCQEIDKLEPVLSKLADYLHQHPEISMQEIKAVENVSLRIGVNIN